MDSQRIYKILRYSTQFVIIYLLLRYIPQINLSASLSLIIALLLTSLCVITEFVYNKIASANDDDCNTCAITKQEGTCRMVCDNMENFDALPSRDAVGQNVDQSHTVLAVPITQRTKEEIEHALAQRHAQQTELQKVQVEQLNQTIKLQPENLPNTFNLPSPKVMFAEQEKHTQQIQQQEKQEDMTNMNVKTVGILEPTKQPYPTGGATSNYTPEYLTEASQPNKDNETLNRLSNMERDAIVEQNAHTAAGFLSPYQVPGPKSQKNQPIQYNVRLDGNIINEMDYTDFDYNSLPIGSGYKDNMLQNYGYSFLPPSQWFRHNVHNVNYVPRTEREDVYPVLANGTPANNKDFYSASSFTGTQGINVSYISDKLNAGR